MRMLMQFQLPIEPFNTLVKNGTVGSVMETVLGDIKPESVYFTAQDGHRGGIAIVNMDNTNQMPALAEPLFLAFNAKVTFQPVMTPEDLASGNLDSIGSKYK